MKHYNYGLRAEDRLAGAYSRRGHTTSYYERSRGPTDIVVARGGRRLHIQVKAVRSQTARILDAATAFKAVSARLNDVQLATLVHAATESGGQPAVALTNGDYYWTWRLKRTRDGHDFRLVHHGWLPKRPLVR